MIKKKYIKLFRVEPGKKIHLKDYEGIRQGKIKGTRQRDYGSEPCRFDPGTGAALCG